VALLDPDGARIDIVLGMGSTLSWLRYGDPNASMSV
jgi:hypothetical protein